LAQEGETGLADMDKVTERQRKKVRDRMTPLRFSEICEEFISKEQEILNWKRKEYSSQDDRLQNFREIAALTGTSMPQVALTYLLKHIQSIKNAVMTGNVDWCWEGEGGEGMKQRIADSRNYLLLLAACLDEEAITNATVPDVCSCEKCKKE